MITSNLNLYIKLKFDNIALTPDVKITGLGARMPGDPGDFIYEDSPSGVLASYTLRTFSSPRPTAPDAFVIK